MHIPSTMNMGGHVISIYQPIEPIVRQDGKVVLGLARPVKCEILIGHPSVIGKSKFGEAFLHETIEMADAIYDLNLPHQTIQTLSAVMYQAFSSGGVSFAEAA